MKQTIFIFSAIIIILLNSCKKDSGDKPVTIFNVTPDNLTFAAEGGISTIKVKMNGTVWAATSNQDWCAVSINTSSKADVQLLVTTSENSAASVRNAKLKFVMDANDTIYVAVSQSANKNVYPDYSNRITPDSTGMTSNAKLLASKMITGWNLGNALEVPGGETGWGNPMTTQTLIDSVYNAGINTIRIPCAWDSYIEDAASCRLKASWLARVKEVVNYCFKNNMYVILNIHWDGGWLENNPTSAMQKAVNAKQKALWQQIAVNFRGFDEHLLFAGTNEVHSNTNPTSENFTVQMSYNQTFVDAVRSTGGKNAYRNLVIQAYNTNIDQAVSNLIRSKDSVANRLMVEVHYYDPWEFCGLEADASWGTVKNLWGIDFAQFGTISSWGQEDYVLTQFQKMKTSFVDKGYPVILGEYGAMRRSALSGSTLDHHLASRAYYFQYIARQAKNHGMVPFLWDNGATSNLGSAIFNRSDGSVFDRQALNAYIYGASAGTYPF
jgi:endoglucanase